jgi:hypothetical protein
LADIASSIAGRPVSIRCPGALERLTEVPHHDGSVEFSADGRPADHADLSGATCSRLADLDEGAARGELDCLGGRTRCPREIEQTAVAVNVLTHESYHLAGHRSERTTQCYAMQRNAEAARLLGATPEQASAVARFVWEHVYPALPHEYRPPTAATAGRSTSGPRAPSGPKGHDRGQTPDMASTRDMTGVRPRTWRQRTRMDSRGRRALRGGSSLAPTRMTNQSAPWAGSCPRRALSCSCADSLVIVEPKGWR